MNGLVVPPGQGRKLITKAQEVTFKVTGAHGSFASCFEVLVPPGFDVGAHTHDHAKEFFYILEGELEVCAFEPVRRIEESWQDWESPDGNTVVRAGAGSCMFVPTGCPHAFRNPTDKPARITSRNCVKSSHMAGQWILAPWNSYATVTMSTRSRRFATGYPSIPRPSRRLP